MLRLLRTSLRAALAWTATVLGGAYLLLLYFLTIWISVGSLAAIQLRANFEEATAAPAERGQTFADVEMAFRQYSLREQGINDSIDGLWRSLWEEEDEHARLLNQREAALAQVAAQLGKEPNTLDLQAFENGIEFKLNARDCDRIGEAAYDAAPPKCRAYFDYRAIDLAASESKIGEIWTQISATEAAGTDQLKALMQDETLSRHFPTYRFFTQVLGLGSLLTVPSEILVLVVTMAMGILGSVVTMTWLFIRDDSTLTLRRFIVLPFIGAISAFIIFILVSAGQLTLTAGDANDSLNPYVLSFIGVISGLLSERAYNRVADVGENFFSVDDGQPRWGSRLREAMAGEGVTEAELARYLGVSEEEAARIVGESTTATLEQQRLIAACLRRTVRELFTDVPPDAPGAVAAARSVEAPDLAGLDRPGLERALAAAGFRIGTVTEAPAEGAEPGRVIEQNPPPGERLPRGSPVDATVAAAPPPEEGGHGPTPG